VGVTGLVLRVNGSVVEATAMHGAAMLEIVAVGERGLPGEVIAVEGDRATIQVYEYTGGLSPGEPVVGSGLPLSAELGPGLLGGVFDGMLRALEAAPDFLRGGAAAESLARSQRWAFAPVADAGSHVAAGDLLGTVPETPAAEHRVLVPPGVAGTLDWIAPAGDFGVEAPIARVGGAEVSLLQRWPVRMPRPYRERLEADVQLVTGQRVLDLLYPIAHGSTAAVPGGFGTGKTMVLQQIAKWCDADVIVYVACGERGNELADVLHELRSLVDPRDERPLLERTVLIANTSNMPVMAREASIHAGLTVAEYYRDMGLDVVVIADSTSRWAEALRELASRTDELPAEEGYPARLSSAIAAFYARAGRVRTLGGDDGSVTILGAVSPPGNDLTEPVTAHTRRSVRCVWSLDRDLAYARHYPAVTWRDSSSRDAAALARWHAGRSDPDWSDRRSRAIALLDEADRRQVVADLVGVASLPASERLTLWAARILRELVLRQSSLNPNEVFCAPAKQAALLRLALEVHDACQALAARGVEPAAIEALGFRDALRARDESAPDDAGAVDAARVTLLARLAALP
jgi:V/A-type H+/Na+-transporting ATPase subunit A